MRSRVILFGAGVLLAGTLLAVGIAQAVSVGTPMMMQPPTAGTGGTPPGETFNILTESGDAIITEASDHIVTEAAP